MKNGKSGNGLAYFKLVHLMFFSSLIALSPLSINASEPINIPSKSDLGYYEGNYGKGAYWVTPGLYSSMFNIHGKRVTDKPKRYFIYSRGYLDKTSPHQTHHSAAPISNKHIDSKLRLPRKINLIILRIVQSKRIVQV